METTKEKHWSENPETEFECQNCGTKWKLGDSIVCPKCEVESE